MKRCNRRNVRVSTFQWTQQAKSPQTKLEEIVERLEEHAITMQDLNTQEKEQRKEENGEKEPPINIIVFDGGAMRMSATVAMYEEISKRFKDKNISDYFDLVGGTSAGAVVGFQLKMHKGDDDKIMKESVSYAMGVTENRKPKLSLWKLLKSGYATDHLFSFTEEYFGKDAPLYMPSGLKVFAVATRRVDFDSPKQPSSFEPYLMRSYEIDPQDTSEQKLNKEDDTAPTSAPETQSKTYLPLPLPGTSKIKLWEAMAATTALPVLSKRLEVDIEGEKHRFADGLVICNSPVAIAIAEARCLWPSRPIGVVLSFGLARGEDELNQRAVEAAKRIDPDLHYLRLYPPFQGFSINEMDETKHEELRERSRSYINETKAKEVEEMLDILASSSQRETRNSIISERESLVASSL